MKSEIKIGMEVWFENNWDTICSGKVTKFYDEAPEYVEIKGTRETYGTMGAKIANCYLTKEELLAALQTQSNQRQAEYCAAIKDVNDLVRFMYENNVCCAEEYTNWDARRAAKTRAKELLGIDLDD